MTFPSPLVSLVSIALLSTAACSAAPGTTAEETASAAEPLSTEAHVHSCESDSDCSASDFCDTEGAGDQCGGAGVCTTRGENLFCSELDELLCGCDGLGYPNACFAHKAGVSIDASPWKDVDVTAKELRADPFTDVTQTYFYTFDTHGKFVEQTVPACERSTPHCDLMAAPEEGTFTKHGSKIELTYANGNVAHFVSQENCYGKLQLVGNDFGQALTLAPTSATP